ncbi:DEAD/DEAH box helicase [Candidatus Micrarchaeota archaeon]|nr:DEAD/DEAH box helicase [Candidatus Micrarchaeota archaeon]
MKFVELKLDGKTVKSINNYGYMEATEVQEKTIPQIIAGNNLIVRSQTGTGKTAAFGIGLMERITSGSTDKALILVPTRELAVQVCTELRGLCHVQQLKICSVYGGQSMGIQIRDLEKRYEILVATPGRLLDLYRRRKVDLSKFNAIVLDEADHMLDLGFQTDVFEILDKLPKEMLMLLFSATVDQSIKRIASRYMPNSETITIGEMEVVSTIKEEQLHVPHSGKFTKLVELLKLHTKMKILVFARTRRGVIRLKKSLENSGFRGIGMLQGDMPQARRIKVLTQFKENGLSVLIATNVASRGLHIDNVGLIINYDRAENKETHLHRVGRTGRMGAEGKVINFVSNDEPRPSRGRRQGNRRSSNRNYQWHGKRRR